MKCKNLSGIIKNQSRNKCFQKRAFALQHFAFTLAEVLIVLGIIGIVAELTIPTLIHDAQSKQFATGLAHFISDFNNGLGQIKNDMGCSDLACTGIWDTGEDPSTDEFWTRLKATGKLRIVKDCGLEGNKGCFSATSTYLNNVTLAPIETGDNGIARGILSNGVSIGLWDVENNCSGKNFWGYGLCGNMWIDVNGLAKPNKAGRDIFYLIIENDAGVIAYGTHRYKNKELNHDELYQPWDSSTAVDGKITSCDPVNIPAGTGITCAGRIEEQGWQMNY